MNDPTKGVDLEDIARFFWKMRIPILATMFVIGLFFINIIIESRSFSSANLDRASRGVYRVRAEVDRQSNREREDEVVDFDKDMELIVSKEHGVLLISLANKREDIVIDRMHVRGRLRNRLSDDFHLIDVRNYNTNLVYNEVSSKLPISIFKTNEYHQRDSEMWEWLVDIREFRENFELHFIDISFYPIESWNAEREARIYLRYYVSTDTYQLRYGAEHLHFFVTE